MAPNLTCNPWLAIWVRPRRTIREIVDTNPRFGLLFLYFLYGLPTLLGVSQSFMLAQYFSLTQILVASVFLALPVGYLGMSIFSFFLKWTGTWIGGTARYQEVRAAVAWANLPSVLYVVTILIQLVMFKEKLFSPGFASNPQAFTTPQLAMLFYIFVVQTVISIWAFVLLIKTVAEVQGFSAWKGLFNIVIPIVLLALVVWVIMFISVGVGGMFQSKIGAGS